MASTTQMLRQQEKLEVIEWDVPISQNNESEYIDFSKLSINTEMRSKLWDTKYLNQYQQGSNNSSPLLDQNQNFTYDMHTALDMNNLQLGTSSSGGNMQGFGHSNNSIINVMPDMMNNNKQFIRNMQQQQQPISTSVSQQSQVYAVNNKPRIKNQPLLHHSPVTTQNSSERKTPELLSSQENHYTLDAKRINESQTIKEELLEMKSIFTRLATQTDDITGLPEPVQLALKVINLETSLQDRGTKVENLEEKIIILENDKDKTKKELDFQLNKQKEEIQYLKKKLDNSKSNVNKGYSTVQDGENDNVDKLKDEIRHLKDSNDQKIKEVNDRASDLQHQCQLLQGDVLKKEKQAMRADELLKEHQASEMYHKSEVKRYFTAAREGMERERQDRYLLLVEQNKLKHKIEKLSENCKSYQMKNEELCRIQNELEQECDQFRKLKKIIQEHGLPNHEQLIILQQQTEMFKDDMLSERKDRERAQAQREKMRRDLEILQSRNQSLQEQVYKYQEHIMRLNTGDRRYAGTNDFIGQMNQQFGSNHIIGSGSAGMLGGGGSGGGGSGGGKFSRQLSSPAYFNPKIRMEASNVNSTMMKSQMNLPLNQVPGGVMNRQDSPVGSRMSNGSGYPNAAATQERGRRPPGYGAQFDPWQQRNNMQAQQPLVGPPPQRNNTMQNTLNNITNRAPRSPLLGPNGDPWFPPNAQNNGSNQQQQISQGAGLTYPSNIWSHQGPHSPSSFASSNEMQNSSQSSSPSWQYNNDAHQNNYASSPQSDSLGGESWSTATTDDQHVNHSNTSNGNDQFHENNKDESSQLHCIEGGFQCGKCNTKCDTTDAFRMHIEKCFN